MDALLAAIAQSDVAAFLRVSRWGYASVNGCHVLGIALLVGAIVPLDLRLMGVWRKVPHAVLARVLVPVAGSGLVLAVVMGTLLFAVRAPEYAGQGVFQVKMAVVMLGATSALAAHWRFGWWLERADGDGNALRWVGAVSIACWLGALGLGRVIGFME